jgi:hypothetical protein
MLRVGIEEILIQPGLSDEHRESVADLLQQTRRLSSVAENLLLLSRAARSASLFKRKNRLRRLKSNAEAISNCHWSNRAKHIPARCIQKKEAG